MVTGDDTVASTTSDGAARVPGRPFPGLGWRAAAELEDAPTGHTDETLAWRSPGWPKSSKTSSAVRWSVRWMVLC